MKKLRIQKEIESAIKNNIRKYLDKDLVKLKVQLLEGYDNLSNWGYDSNSKANPSIYREVFKTRIEDFNYITIENNGFSFSLPSITKFDFLGIEVIQQILEGTIGEFYEIPESVVRLISIPAILNFAPLADANFTGENYYLINLDNALADKLKRFNISLTRFPFSNTPPLEDVVFSVVDSFASDNNKKIKMAIEESISMATQKYRRI